MTSPLPPVRPLPGPPTGPTAWPAHIEITPETVGLGGDLVAHALHALGKLTDGQVAEVLAYYPPALPPHGPVLCLTDPALNGRTDVGDLTERMSPPARWQMTGDVVSVEARP